jgi:hypothetical protein
MISTAHFENAAPLLQSMDLGLLLVAQERAAAGDPSAIADLLAALAAGGKAKAFRKLAALASATVEEVILAETDVAKLAAMEIAAAKRPFLEVVQEAMGFFSALVPTSSATPASSTPPAGAGEAQESAEPKAPEDTPSAAS